LLVFCFNLPITTATTQEVNMEEKQQILTVQRRKAGYIYIQ